MNSRIASLVSAVKNMADACSPVLRSYKVQYFKKIPFPAQPGMFAHEWTVEYVEGYGTQQAAQKINPKLRPGYNCFVTLASKPEADDGAV